MMVVNIPSCRLSKKSMSVMPKIQTISKSTDFLLKSVIQQFYFLLVACSKFVVRQNICRHYS